MELEQIKHYLTSDTFLHTFGNNNFTINLIIIMVGGPCDWLDGCLARCLVTWLTGQVFDWMADWPSDWLDGQLVGWTRDWLMVNWLAGKVID